MVNSFHNLLSAILKDEADTEDLVQDIFLKIWEERETEQKEKLGISPKTVQYHISNVLARLKKLL